MWVKQSANGYLSADRAALWPTMLATVLLLQPVSEVFSQENYGAWPNSVKIHINTTSSGANVSRDVYNFPLLVRLNPATFKGFAKTLPGGADIRFAKPNGVHLSYEIERWRDGLDGTDSAEIWVLVDTIFGNNPDQNFLMYWGKSGVASQSNPRAVFKTGNGFLGVWHLNTPDTDIRPDATSNLFNAGVHNAIFANGGAIAGCDTFVAANDSYDSIAGGINLVDKSFTITAWFKLAEASPSSYQFILGQGWWAADSGLHFGYRYDTAYPHSSRRMTFAFFNDDLEQASVYSGGTDWHLLVGTYNLSDRRQSLYYDGALDNSRTTIGNYKGRGVVHLGKRFTMENFNGKIDEVRIETAVRSPAWIKLSYETQKQAASCMYLQETSPSITKHPSDVSALIGTAATMTVAASGPLPFTYIWYKNAAVPGNAMANQNTSALFLRNVQEADAGSYLCVVQNKYGADTSHPARLTVGLDTGAVTNPIVVRGAFRDSIHVALTIGRYALLPVAPGTLSSWYADTVMVWYRTVSFPSGTPLSSTAALKLPLAAMKALPGDTFATVLAVPKLGCDNYFFKGSVQWRNNTTNPAKVSLAPFGGDAGGAVVYMCDTSRLANPLVMTFRHAPPDSQVTVTIDSVKSAALRWDLITGATLAYSIAGNPFWTTGTLTAERLRKGGDTCMVTVADARFIGLENAVYWRLVLTGANNNAADTVKGSCTIGAPRPENTIVVKADSIWSTKVKLLWSRSGEAVDYIRIWYGRQQVPYDPEPSMHYGAITVPGGDTAAVIGPLDPSTLWHFGLQVQRAGVWSLIPAAAGTFATTPPQDPGEMPIANTIRLDGVVFDGSTNRLHFTANVDAASEKRFAGIVWKMKGDPGAFPQPCVQPPIGKILEIKGASSSIADSLGVDGFSILFETEYLFAVWMQGPNGLWSRPTDSSTRLFRIPGALVNWITCFKDPVVSAFGGAVVLEKIAELGNEITTGIHLVAPPPHYGLIPQSNAFRFEPQGAVPDAPVRLGLRHHPIPPGFTINDIRMYHFDTARKQWYVDTVPDRNPVTWIVSIRVPFSHCKHTFLLAIDTARPVVAVSGDTGSAVMPGTDLFVQAQVWDNIANPLVLLRAGRGDDSLLYKKAVPFPAQAAWTIPGGYVEGGCGMRVLLSASDGRLTETIDLSRDIRIPDDDIVPPEFERWMPLAPSVTLDNAAIPGALNEFSSPGKPWEYDISKLRLFQWAGRWLEYSEQVQNRFSLVPGRVIWLKTRMAGRNIHFGGGRTVSLKQPYTILLTANDWTDFSLPYRFNIRIGDIVQANIPSVSKALQFYVWKKNQTGRFFTSELYLPSNGPPYNDKHSELAYLHDGERTVYSVFNPLAYDVALRIPGTPVALSDIPAERTTTTDGWSIAVRSRTGENEELSPVFCAYKADHEGITAYPQPPSWSDVRVGIYDASSKSVYGNVIRSGLVNGGCAYQLVFENRSAAATRISYTVERLAGTDMHIRIFDPESGTIHGADSTLDVEVRARCREYRWLAVGKEQYLDGVGGELTKKEFTLARTTPNPFRGTLRIEFTIPYGMESVRCELIDQLGRVVWSAAERENARPGRNEFFWNPRKRILAAGAYIVRLTGFDGNGKKKGERLARVMYVP